MDDIEIRELHTDEWSRTHMWERHQIALKEAMEVCHSSFVALAGKKGRILLVGPTLSGNLLTVVVAPEGDGIYYIVTARPAYKTERRYYREQKAQEEQ
jgi:uncharacterized DUF497 family protein